MRYLRKITGLQKGIAGLFIAVILCCGFSGSDPFLGPGILEAAGHLPCGTDDTTAAHGTSVLAGISLTGNRSGITFYTGPSEEYRRKLTTLHEISHCLGALGGNVDQEHNNTRCVMSAGATRDNATLLGYWENGAYTSLFCSDCQTLIRNYLKYN